MTFKLTGAWARYQEERRRWMHSAEYIRRFWEGVDVHDKR